MMPSEFEERTGYTPSNEEYHYIEESYYDFNGNKDDFCKQWLKDRKAGFWQKELNFRKKMDEMMEQHKGELAEKEDNLNWYREQHTTQRNQIKGLQQEVEELKKQNEELEKQADERELAARKDVNITLKDGEEIYTGFAVVRYINNNGFCFINVVQESGWTDSYKMDDIARIEIA